MSSLIYIEPTMHQDNKVSMNVGIIIPTMNRPDFIIRQLEYYASLSSPHSIYIADSSNPTEAAQIKTKVDELKNKINIQYCPYPPGDVVKCVIFLLTQVKEKYVCSIGDDDFRVPGTLTECAKFLEANPDYISAIGQSVTIRVADNRAYGKLTSIHDYPRYPIESNKASERLLEFMSPHISSIIASVIRTEDLLKYYRTAWPYKDDNFRGEIIPSCLMIINGKSKVIDKIDLVRQIHASHFKIDDMFDQITSDVWPETYRMAKKDLANVISDKDGLSSVEAEIIIKKAFWGYLEYMLSRFYKDYAVSIDQPKPKSIKIRTKIGIHFPFIKKLYKKVRSILGFKEKLYYQVTQPSSKYYKDFQPILLSLNKK